MNTLDTPHTNAHEFHSQRACLLLAAIAVTDIISDAIFGRQLAGRSAPPIDYCRERIAPQITYPLKRLSDFTIFQH